MKRDPTGRGNDRTNIQIRNEWLLSHKEYQVGLAIQALQKAGQVFDDEDVRIREVKVGPSKDGEGVIVTLKGTYDGRRVIGWSGGADLNAALINAADRVRAKTIKWREDVYAYDEDGTERNPYPD